MKTLNQENIKPTYGYDNDRDFSFEFSFALGYKPLHVTPLFVYADELFDGGMIKPLKVFKDSNPLLPKGKETKTSSQRKDSSTSLSSKVFKSSPKISSNIQRDSKETMDKSSLGSRSWSPSLNKKWKLKDLLLFRSVSEGHGSARDDHCGKCHETVPFGVIEPSNYSQVKNGRERRRKKQGISAHERHYTAHERHYTGNRRAGEEIKRKTFLPYKKTLLMGCSDLDPGVHEFCKGHAVEIKC